MHNGLEKVWPESEKWLKDCNVKKTDYHGGSFAGNESRMILKNVDRQTLIPSDMVTMKFVDAFRYFNQVVSACYGDSLSVDYMKIIRKSSISHMKLKINATPKIHAVVYHAVEFCSLKGRGLAAWSEQTGESLHHDFNKAWEKFKVKDIDHPLYGENLLKAVYV